MAAKTSAQRRIDKAVKEVAYDYPAISWLLSRAQFRPTDKIETLGVDAKSRGVYNPDYIDGLTDLQIKGSLIHESMHITLNHMNRFAQYHNFKDFDEAVASHSISPRKFDLWNVAADCFINENIIHQFGSKSLGKNVVTFSDISKALDVPIKDFARGCAEDVYGMFLKKDEERQKEQEDQRKEMEEHLKDMIDALNDLIKRTPKSMSEEVAAAIEEAFSKGASNDSALNPFYENQGFKMNEPNEHGVGGTIDFRSTCEMDDIDKVMFENNINWRTVLSKFTHEVAGNCAPGRSWRKPSKRYRNSGRLSKGKVRNNSSRSFSFGIDVSGSMDQGKIARAFAVLRDYARQHNLECKYYMWSTHTTDVFRYRSEKEFREVLDNNYGGGTSISCALDWTKEMGEGIVLVTDAEFNAFDAHDFEEVGKPVVVLDIEPNRDRKESTIQRINSAHNATYVPVYTV